MIWIFSRIPINITAVNMYIFIFVIIKLYTAITKKNILAANYPFATIDPNVGVVVVPDKRVAMLEEMYIPERTIPTTYWYQLSYSTNTRRLFAS